MIEILNEIDTYVFLSLHNIHSDFLDSFMMLFSGRYIWIPFYAALAVLLWRTKGTKSFLAYLVGIGIAIALTDQVCATVIRPHAFDERAYILEYEDIRIDTISHSVSVCGQAARLTRTEYAILKLLMQNPSQVVTKTLLLERLSEDTPDCMESSLRVHISNLRKKLRDLSGRDYIEAVWGIGFKLKDD